MPMTDAERQKKRRKGMREAGYSQVLLWIQPDRKETLKRLCTRLRKADDVELLSIHRTLARLENRG